MSDYNNIRRGYDLGDGDSPMNKYNSLRGMDNQYPGIKPRSGGDYEGMGPPLLNLRL